MCYGRYRAREAFALLSLCYHMHIHISYVSSSYIVSSVMNKVYNCEQLTCLDIRFIHFLQRISLPGWVHGGQWKSPVNQHQANSRAGQVINFFRFTGGAEIDSSQSDSSTHEETTDPRTYFEDTQETEAALATAAAAKSPVFSCPASRRKAKDNTKIGVRSEGSSPILPLRSEF